MSTWDLITLVGVSLLAIGYCVYLFGSYGLNLTQEPYVPRHEMHRERERRPDFLAWCESVIAESGGRDPRIVRD